jgi:hypothetical protein
MSRCLSAALGDLLAAALALLAIPAAKWLVWVFNVEGMLDVQMAIALATSMMPRRRLWELPTGSQRFGCLACW